MDSGPDTAELIDRLPWPLVTLDFEASALGPRSYPIEVGIARWQSPDAPIQVWSALIRPTIGWREGGNWNLDSQLVHGIRESDLESGESPTSTMATLNQLVGENTVWCDGGSYDEYWLTVLQRAAGVEALFHLRDWDALGAAFSSVGYERMVRWLDRASVRHRAGDDAERLLKAIAVGLGRNQGDTVPMSNPPN